MRTEDQGTGTARGGADTLPHRFERVAAADPAAVAVRTERAAAPYGVLAEASDALAARLAPAVAGRPGPVAVLCEPGPGQLCAALAALRCGKPYLPIDPAYPRHRVDRVLADAAPAAMFSDPEPDAHGAEGLLDPGGLVSQVRLSAGRWGDGTEVTGDDAYVIYTSGSTGTPKGIAIPHVGIVNLMDDFEARRRLPPGSRHNASASPGFDASVWETWTSLTSGGELLVMPDGPRWHATDFVDWLADQHIANAYVPAAFLTALAQAPGLGVDLGSLQRLMVGAEPIRRGLLGAIKRALPGVTLLNAYGPTEATVCCLVYEVTADDRGRDRAPIGTPIRNTELRVEPLGAAPAGRTAEPGTGELHVGGAGVGRYLRPERGRPPAYYARTTDGGTRRYYRTGDVVRVDAAGTYTFVGRVDEVVNIRGYRVEPGDVEHTLLQYPGIDQAVVLKQDFREGPGLPAERLVAYVVPAPGARLGLSDVRARLRERLPWYAVPHRVVVRETLPLNEHGKVDRRALAAVAAEPSSAARPREAPQPPAEPHEAGTDPELLRLWNAVLGPAAPRPRASFLANGGDSLAAGRLAAAVAKSLGRRVPVLDVLLAGSLDDLQTAVRRAPRARAPAPGLRCSPLTSAQQGLILDEQRLGEDGAYAESCLIPLPNPVETARLRQAVARALHRHPAIGGSVRERDHPHYDTVLHLGQGADVRVHRLATPPGGAAELTRLADRLRREPMDLREGPLGRAQLIAAPEGTVALLLTLHHIICDTWSLQLLLADIATAFADRPFPAMPAATACDFAEAQRAALSRSAIARRAAVLATAVPAGPRVPDPSPPRPSVLRRALTGEVVARLGAAAMGAGVTVFAAVCAAFEMAVREALGDGPFLYATPVARRDDPGFAQVVGYLINVAPVVPSVTSPALRDPGDLLAAVGRQVTAALAAAHLPYPELVHALRARGVHQPPHQRMVVYESPLRLRLAGSTATGCTLPPVVARSDVHLSVLDRRGGLDIDLYCAATRVGPASAAALLDAFERSLRLLSG